MIIVSQDKRSIVNFKKVNIICINQFNKKQIAAWFNCNEVENNDVLLGTYSTEERAKEVLEEIIESYLNSIDYKYNQTLLIGDLEEYREGLVYKMPQE